MRLPLFPLFYFSLAVFASQDQQIIMESAVQEPYSPATHKPTLADLLTIEPSASIFYSYAREIELSIRLSDPEAQSTLFVPTNKIIMSLSRKPHQGPEIPVDEGVEISEQEFDARSKRNVERWISTHIVPEHPISLVSRHQTLLSGKFIVFKPVTKGNGQGPEWSRVTLEDGIHIVGMKEGSNGVLYFVDGAISYD